MQVSHKEAGNAAETVQVSYLDQYADHAEQIVFAQPLELMPMTNMQEFQRKLRELDRLSQGQWIIGRYSLNGLVLPSIFRVKKIRDVPQVVQGKEVLIPVMGIVDGHAFELNFADIDQFHSSTQNEQSVSMEQKRVMAAFLIAAEATKELVAKAEHRVYSVEHSIDTDDHKSALLATLANVVIPTGDNNGWFGALRNTGRADLTVHSELPVAAVSHDLHNALGNNLQKRLQGLTRSRVVAGVRSHEFSIHNPTGLNAALFFSPPSRDQIATLSSSPLETAMNVFIERSLPKIVTAPDVAIETTLELANQEAPIKELHREVQDLRRKQ